MMLLKIWMDNWTLFALKSMIWMVLIPILLLYIAELVKRDENIHQLQENEKSIFEKYENKLSEMDHQHAITESLNKQYENDIQQYQENLTLCNEKIKQLNSIIRQYDETLSHPQPQPQPVEESPVSTQTPEEPAPSSQPLSTPQDQPQQPVEMPHEVINDLNTICISFSFCRRCN